MSAEMIEAIGYVAAAALFIGGIQLFRTNDEGRFKAVLMVIAALVLLANLLIINSFPDQPR